MNVNMLKESKRQFNRPFIDNRPFYSCVPSYLGIRSIESCGMIHVMIDCQL